MSNTVKQLGFIPTNRGEFDTTGQTRYYKDNVVQYRNGSYICSPVGYSTSNPTAYTTDAPYQDGDTELNANWKLMASVGLVDDEPTAGSDNLVKSRGVYLDLINYSTIPFTIGSENLSMVGYGGSDITSLITGYFDDSGVFHNATGGYRCQSITINNHNKAYQIFRQATTSSVVNNNGLMLLDENDKVIYSTLKTESIDRIFIFPNEVKKILINGQTDNSIKITELYYKPVGFPITEDKTKFFNTTKNIFRPEREREGVFDDKNFYLNYPTFITYEEIPVESEKTYYFSLDGSSLVVSRVISRDIEGNYISSSYQTSVNSYTTPLNAYTIDICLLKSTVLGHNIQIELNSVSSYIQPFILKDNYLNFDSILNYINNNVVVSSNNLQNNSVTESKIADKSVSINKVSFSEQGKNLFNKDSLSIGLLYQGTILDSYSQFRVSDKIPVEALATYRSSVNGVSNALVCARIAQYGSDGTTVIDYSDNFNSSFITISEGVSYLRICFNASTVTDISHIQIEKGDNVTSFEPYKLVIQKSVLPDTEERPEVVLPDACYVLKDYENSIYHKNIVSFKNPLYEFDGNSAIWNFYERCYRTSTGSTGTLNVLLKKLSDLTSVSSRSVVTRIGNPLTDNGNKKVNVIGDSFTQSGIWYNFINENCPNLTFVGMRQPSNGYGIDVSQLRSEGRSGWSLESYFQPYGNLTPTHMQPFSPFMHVNGYTYYGPIQFWKVIVNGTSQNISGTVGFDDYISWFDSTGHKVNPSMNDLMYDGDNDKYIYWNGSTWADFDGTPTFEFNYAKYIDTWNISSPDFVLIMLGVNDWFSAYTNELASTWNERMNIVINSIRSYATNASKTIFIGLCTNTTVIGTGNNNYYKNANINSRNIFLGRKNLIKTFDKTSYVSNNVYVVDTGACLDPDYGFDLQEIKPFSYYEGNERELYDRNGVHPSPAGYKQLGTCAAGFIQYIRGLSV